MSHALCVVVCQGESGDEGDGQSKLPSKLQKVKEEARRLAWRNAVLLSLGMVGFLR
jgi:hypothetical protein